MPRTLNQLILILLIAYSDKEIPLRQPLPHCYIIQLTPVRILPSSRGSPVIDLTYPHNLYLLIPPCTSLH